ncbi:MAG: hypothetical protein S4CHLAM81_08010 [Chlamydiales bacterium]|nr:hypothetical protein [Chlamydiales bacterium]
MGGLEALPPLDLQSFTVNGAGALDHIPVEEEAEMERPLEEIAPEDLVLPDDPTPLRRTARGRPKKSKKMFLRLHPMSVQWDVSKNGPIPDKLTSGSGKKYWWKCGKGHSWQARVADRCRIKQPKGCPKCARSFGGRLVKEHALANQWDVSKNGPIPEDLTCGSNKRVWWQCEKEHSWETRVLSRCKVKNHPGCPKCMGKSSHRGFVKDHKVAAQWDVVRNGQIPEDLTCGSNKRVWWKCEKRHSWQARVRQRCHLKKPSGCPKCAGKAPARGFVKDHPAADQWDVFKNGPLPDDLSCGMNQKFFWKCEKGHSWQAMVRNRCHLKKPSGCPTCSKSKKRAREADERVQQPLKKK